MELRPRKGRSAQPPSTPTLVKPTPRKPPPRPSSRQKSAPVPPAIIITSDEDANTEELGDHDARVSPICNKENHENDLSVEFPLSEIVKPGRSVSSAIKLKAKSVSAVKERRVGVSYISEKRSIPSELKQGKGKASELKERNVGNRSLSEHESKGMDAVYKPQVEKEMASDLIVLDDDTECDEVDVTTAKSVKSFGDDDNGTSNESAREESRKKGEKSSLIRKLMTKARRVSKKEKEDVPNDGSSYTMPMEMNDQEQPIPSRVSNSTISDEFNQISLALSDDENDPVSEKKHTVTHSENGLNSQILNAVSVQKFQVQNECFNEENIRKRLFEESSGNSLPPTEKEPRNPLHEETCKLSTDSTRIINNDNGGGHDAEIVNPSSMEKLQAENECCNESIRQRLEESSANALSSSEEETSDPLCEEKCNLSTDSTRIMNNNIDGGRVESTIEMVDGYEEPRKEFSEGSEEIEQSNTEILDDAEEIGEKPAADPDALCNECNHGDTEEDSQHDERVEVNSVNTSFTGRISYEVCESVKEPSSVQVVPSNRRAIDTNQDPVQHDQYFSSDSEENSDNNTESSSSDDGEDQDEENLASIFASSMKKHLQISEPRKIQTNQDVQEGVRPLMDAGSKGPDANGTIRRWSPKVTLSAKKKVGTSETKPTSFWLKNKSLQDGLCVPPLSRDKLNKLARKQRKDTAGDKWFNVPAPIMTPELKQELQLVKLRGVLDPKRHYKAEDSRGLPKYFQVGTVVGGPADFYSGRLTKREQKASLASELLADSSLSAYRKRKYLEIQDQKQAGGKGFFKKKQKKRKPSWAHI
ncbi:hypothetical protein KP509_12G058700 [Ceratopteris richardii]|uniref:Fcf2 pre-rRNA processing C-terminal domain-containing protein n=1 Tax=Ceratopteris richardii TaxID=49495 RepID=A0A8T2TNZ8_CERRI|nr:hypothetical protein KP509_12G058700 [Ceratopteris richardii]